MTSYIIVSIISGILFGIMDGLINANPIANKSVQSLQGHCENLDQFCGRNDSSTWRMGSFWPPYSCFYIQACRAKSGLLKGISFAVMVWFFRVVMSVASQWMMYKVPGKALLYTLLAGLGEMLILGILYGLALQPTK